jgi:isopentenyldiphosphate isomerase
MAQDHSLRYLTTPVHGDKMGSAMEIFDLYDRDRNRTGETMLRGQRPPKGRYHMVVHICIFNQDGQMLIQKRSKAKGFWAGMWDVSVGGAAQIGDSSWQAAQRELVEELGIEFDFSEVRPAVTVNFEFGFDDVYLINLNPELSELHLQVDEVAEVAWADQNTIMEMIENGEFLPYHPNLIRVFFDLRFYPGFFEQGRIPGLY